MNQLTHVIPLGTPEPLHSASFSCWCHPLPKENGQIAIHNAKDGREKWERQGIIDSDKRWCLVYEDIAVGAKSATTDANPMTTPHTSHAQEPLSGKISAFKDGKDALLIHEDGSTIAIFIPNGDEETSALAYAVEVESLWNGRDKIRAQLAAERAKVAELVAALGVIARNAGTTEDELGMVCNASWCAEQARYALATLEGASK